MPNENEFQRIGRLSPYVFNIVNTFKMDARQRGEDIIDFNMGNPDQPTPAHIIDKLTETAQYCAALATTAQGDTVRFGLIENEHRTGQAIRGIRQIFRNDDLID